MKQSIFADFARVFPQRFNNKTNGITPRRWLAQANPPLAKLIDERIGPDWRRDLNQLGGLKSCVDNAGFVQQFANAKQQNKLRLASWVQSNMGLVLDPDSMFDVQVKRIHEYKRQLLNVLHVITRYNRILQEPEAVHVPRTVIFAGKAASAYHMAKLIIKLINDVATRVNNDPVVAGRLKLLFIPNYSVSLAELIIPAANLSEQISLAGTEASGTGNMKLSLNGALTIGTLDGANIEILEQVGADNIFIFGNTTPQVQDIRAHGYHPRQIYETNAELKLALNQVRDGFFSPDDKGRFQAIFDTLVNFGDHYLLLADYARYLKAQEKADDLYRNQAMWNRKALLNVSGMGPFSSDRTIADYANDIWRVKPVRI
jgi:starch phosphorylase